LIATRGWTAARRRGGLLAAIVALALALSGSPAAAELTPELGARLAVAAADQAIPVIVTLKEQLPPADARGRAQERIAEQKALAERTQPAVLRAAGIRARRFWIANAIALSARPALIRRLARDPAVAGVGLDSGVRAQAEPADPSAAVTPPPLSLSSVAPDSAGWAGAAASLDAVHVRDAWREFGVSGAGVRVGSIDTGVDPTNPEIAGRIVAWHDFYAGRPAPYDDNGHGTHTIGTMIGAGVTGAPIGVAPQATVVVAKALGPSGVGLPSDLLAAAQWMTDPDGNPATDDFPAVVDDSWSAGEANDPWFQQMVQSWVSLGIVPVFAAGNMGPAPSTIPSPASYPASIAVAALDESGAVAPFSARGPVLWTNAGGAGPPAGTLLAKPDLAAPGVDVVSATGDGYAVRSGTSQAAALVAGVVALVHQANPGLRPPQIAQVLRDTAVDLGPPGYDPDSGAGRVDALAAVARAVEGPVPPAVPAQQALGSGADSDTVAARGAAAAHAASRPERSAWPLPLAIRDIRIAMRTGGGRGILVIRGRLPRAARVRAVLLTVARAGASVAQRSMPRGAFELTLPLRTVRPGPYRLVVSPRDTRGRALGPSVTRTVRVPRFARP